MRTRPDLTPDGSVVGPNGTIFRRTDRKLRRRECDELVRAGAPVVTNQSYGDGLEWWDGPDAATRWTRIAPLLVSGSEQPREGWRAHLWESDEGDQLVCFEGWH